jgi:hypothetical protein
MREGKTDENGQGEQFQKIYAGVSLNRLTSLSLNDDDDNDGYDYPLLHPYINQSSSWKSSIKTKNILTVLKALLYSYSPHKYAI